MSSAGNNTATSSEAHARPPRALRVIVVEDNRDSLVTLVDLLRAEGHEARGVGSAREMLKVMDAFTPDVCLVDIGLPDRSGYEVAQDIRRIFGEARPKLIAVTAWTQGSDRMLAKIAGFDRHVGKPYDPNALLALVSELASDSSR